MLRIRYVGGDGEGADVASPGAPVLAGRELAGGCDVGDDAREGATVEGIDVDDDPVPGSHRAYLGFIHGRVDLERVVTRDGDDRGTHRVDRARVMDTLQVTGS